MLWSNFNFRPNWPNLGTTKNAANMTHLWEARNEASDFKMNCWTHFPLLFEVNIAWKIRSRPSVPSKFQFFFFACTWPKLGHLTLDRRARVARMALVQCCVVPTFLCSKALSLVNWRSAKHHSLLILNCYSYRYPSKKKKKARCGAKQLGTSIRCTLRNITQRFAEFQGFFCTTNYLDSMYQHKKVLFFRKEPDFYPAG